MISFTSKGDWGNTSRWLRKMKDLDLISILDDYGRKGVNALAVATPVDTGKTASSWDYEIKKTKEKFTIYWKNTNVNNGIPIAIIIQYGHVTRSGSYVPGVDYINTALEPIFDEISNIITEEVRR